MTNLLKKLAYKDAFLHPFSPAPPGESTPAGKWADIAVTPLFRQACEVAFGEYVTSLTPEPTMPGVMAFRVQGAKEVLGVLMNLGEETKPVLSPDKAKGLVPV